MPTTHQFRSGTVECLGSQLVTLLRTIAAVHPGLVWYIADVDTNGPYRHGSPTPHRIGDSDALIALAQQVDQFLSGVFAGVPSAIESPTFRPGGLWTEDEPGADLGDAIVELRAFDTSYWELATADDAIRHTLA